MPKRAVADENAGGNANFDSPFAFSPPNVSVEVVVAVLNVGVEPKPVKLNPPEATCTGAGAGRGFVLAVVLEAPKRNRASLALSFGASCGDDATLPPFAFPMPKIAVVEGFKNPAAGANFGSPFALSPPNATVAVAVVVLDDVVEPKTKLKPLDVACAGAGAARTFPLVVVVVVVVVLGAPNRNRPSLGVSLGAVCDKDGTFPPFTLPMPKRVVVEGNTAADGAAAFESPFAFPDVTDAGSTARIPIVGVLVTAAVGATDVVTVVAVLNDDVVEPKPVKLNPLDAASVDGGASRGFVLAAVLGVPKRNKPSVALSFGASWGEDATFPPFTFPVPKTAALEGFKNPAGGVNFGTPFAISDVVVVGTIAGRLNFETSAKAAAGTVTVVVVVTGTPKTDVPRLTKTKRDCKNRRDSSVSLIAHLVCRYLLALVIGKRCI